MLTTGVVLAGETVTTDAIGVTTARLADATNGCATFVTCGADAMVVLWAMRAARSDGRTQGGGDGGMKDGEEGTEDEERKRSSGDGVHNESSISAM